MKKVQRVILDSWQLAAIERLIECQLGLREKTDIDADSLKTLLKTIQDVGNSEKVIASYVYTANKKPR